MWNDIQVGDIIQIKMPMFRKRYWQVQHILPSLDPSITLYRIQLLKNDGTKAVNHPITVSQSTIYNHIGGFTEWLKTMSKN